MSTVELLNMAAEKRNGNLNNRSLKIRFGMLKEKKVDISHEI